MNALKKNARLFFGLCALFLLLGYFFTWLSFAYAVTSVILMCIVVLYFKEERWSDVQQSSLGTVHVSGAANDRSKIRVYFVGRLLLSLQMILGIILTITLNHFFSEVAWGWFVVASVPLTMVSIHYGPIIEDALYAITKAYREAA